MRRYKYTITLSAIFIVCLAMILTGCEERVHYADCDAAVSAGATPLNSGDPGYRLALDRNRDGVACEES